HQTESTEDKPNMEHKNIPVDSLAKKSIEIKAESQFQKWEELQS
ncbi:4545_t:CDS:2, partial [Cetraspora pellucida]